MGRVVALRSSPFSNESKRSRAEVEKSAFARAFLDRFVFGKDRREIISGEEG